jgi:hypothetical protein
MASFVRLAFLASLYAVSIRADSITTNTTVISSNNTDCSCGYYDEISQQLYTESVVVYFNESTTVPTESFLIQNYVNDYEKDWNSKYRQSANASNVGFSINSTSNPQSLELYVSPPTKQHVVNGGGLRTAREDIHYGTFTTLMKSPQQWAGGSSLTMLLQYNNSESIEVNMQNQAEPDLAWASTLMEGEFPERDLGANYSVLAEEPTFNNNNTAWDFVEVRIDWTPKTINWTIGGILVRSESKNSMPSAPGPIYLKHWSIGDKYAMDGPPTARSVANIGYSRLFFNSTLKTKQNQNATDFDNRCQIIDACPTSNMNLRGASPYTEIATKRWEQAPRNYGKKFASIVIVILCISFSTLLLVKALVARIPIKTPKSVTEDEKNGESSSYTGSDDGSLRSPPTMFNSEEVTLASAPMTPYNLTRPSSRKGEDFDTIEKIPPMPWSPAPSFVASEPPEKRHVFNKSEATLLGRSTAANSNADLLQKKSKEPIVEVKEIKEEKIEAPAVPNGKPPAAAPLKAKQRVDYLAGLVAVCSLVVTVDHFCSTFVPAITIPGAPYHYSGEVWTKKILSPYLLNQVWVCVFFTTSTRFLSTKYLRDRKLVGIAEKVVGRVFRVMIPITAVVLLEYFLIECGAIYWLEFLPSVSWSTWPYTVGFPNFSNFISEILGLVYLIPNAVPQVTFNYCTGVLWTIPVQIQGSWVILIGVVMVSEIKTPWKRFSYYAFNVLNSWYALSWGSYFWLGLMLADLDITFKWRKSIQAKPILFYFLCITYFSLVILALSQDLVSTWTDISFAPLERGIHPDVLTGRLIREVDPGYPEYYTPRVNGLIFAVCLQALIELSPFVQKIFSAKLLVLVFPHIFTIYLFHGLVFWSIGSFLAIKLSILGLAYWANMLCTAIVCYTLLFLALSIVTPVVEILGKTITANIWKYAYEFQVPKRSTLFPFPKELFMSRS